MFVQAVDNVNSIIAPAVIGKDPTDQTGIDNFMVQELDGTQNEWGWCTGKVGWWHWRANGAQAGTLRRIFGSDGCRLVEG